MRIALIARKETDDAYASRLCFVLGNLAHEVGIYRTVGDAVKFVEQSPGSSSIIGFIVHDLKDELRPALRTAATCPGSQIVLLVHDESAVMRIAPNVSIIGSKQVSDVKTLIDRLLHLKQVA